MTYYYSSILFLHKTVHVHRRLGGDLSIFNAVWHCIFDISRNLESKLSGNPMSCRKCGASKLYNPHNKLTCKHANDTYQTVH